ncbi:MAG: 50S ribosomal protein L18 [Gemmatimonadota bacterium]|nr:50S ribosomal protein L18 [Gemmatimonadota bacterium]MDH3366634.1 50S ribosomal protein L18 [Gemmatimonadota bacterium]MDH3477243.1 50S ribosomal protein L18 [Gemmatimonadota bacterium]MDH3569806.1 50S ribosomal protein L18 [Gemmatimonadota bacterium]MDH5549973.1 50S ribosomal protein L18 [Gemmatimonadota bacterium]
MRLFRTPKTRQERRARRHLRIRQTVQGTGARPRLVVYRSLKHIYAQLVDDEQGVTLVAMSDLVKGVEPQGKGKTGVALAVGKLLATRAKEQGITRVVFDRGGYPYHGRVRAVAEGARDGGLEF